MPAVVVSPYIAAGTVNDTVRDHASVPATLRAVFAPDAPPLTRRDAWSPPFHTVRNLDQPRRDQELPDLSSHVTRQSGEIPLTAMSGHSARARTADMPQYYRDFVAQAEHVNEHLLEVDEPQAAQQTRPAPDEKAIDVTRVFHEAADRHRDELPPSGCTYPRRGSR